MSEEFLSKELSEGLKAAHLAHTKRLARLRVHAGSDVYPVLRYWSGGFALDPADAPHLRGLVDLYDGARHISQCLIVASSEEGGETVYEFKWQTAASDRPPLDFARDEDAPAGLLVR